MGVPDIESRRGLLNPEALPSFHRLAPSAPVADFVHWFWVPEWDLPPGASSRQEVLPYPASNLVVESDDSAVLVGPSTGPSVRELTGRGWAVGALLRPAAASQLAPDLTLLRNLSVVFEAPSLVVPVAAAMGRPGDDHPGDHRERAVQAFSDWLTSQLAPPTREQLLANRLVDLIVNDPSITTVSTAGDRLGISVRTVQRLMRRHVGLSPLAVIRQRRLQDVALGLADPATANIAELAADMGYADQSHLTSEFKSVMRTTPAAYRSRRARGPQPPAE